MFGKNRRRWQQHRDQAWAAGNQLPTRWMAALLVWSSIPL
jgi:hypothetical protein